MKAQFDALYERGAEKPVLMPLTVHDFIIGRPSRSLVLDEFITYAKQFEGVVFTTHDQVRRGGCKTISSEDARCDRLPAARCFRFHVVGPRADDYPNRTIKIV